MEDRDDVGVRAVAHRGASRARPENTLAAFDLALGQGCDGIGTGCSAVTAVECSELTLSRLDSGDKLVGIGRSIVWGLLEYD